MEKGRLQSFSDGVIAIIITIMVLELKIPIGDSLASLKPLIPILISYILSYIYIGIYWNNHHHMFYAVSKINGGILWANLHLLFWLSIIPFVTGWMGENHFTTLPVALYGCVLFMSALAWTILSRSLIKQHGKTSLIATAFGKDLKGALSLILYAIAIFIAFINPWVSLCLYVIVAVMWFIPDRRIEKLV
ncbi:MAG: TMEM175 family protein [Ignavibacteriaceae bacterium]|nr:TMEM175 family protein [Ignavibacteriaceae bacterium]